MGKKYKKCFFFQQTPQEIFWFFGKPLIFKYFSRNNWIQVSYLYLHLGLNLLWGKCDGYITWLYVMLDHPGAIQVPTGTPKWPKTAPRWPRMARHHQNGSKWHCMTPNDPKHFPWVYSMIICHVGPPWALFRGPRGPQNGPKQHQDGPKYHQNCSSWPQMSLHDPKWP